MSCGCPSIAAPTNPAGCVPASFCPPENFGLSFPSLVGPQGPPGGPGTYVETYALLRLLDPTTWPAGYIVFVGGRTAINDGGSGLFEYDPVAVDADNGGTIIAPSNNIGRWFRVYSGPIMALWFASNNGVSNATPGLARAFALGSSLARQVVVSGGTWKVVPATAGTSEAGSLVYAFPFASNTDIAGDIGAIFRIADSVSTQGAPVRMAMFWTNGVVSNIRIVGLTMDMNGANNLINPPAGPWDNSRGQAQIEVSGTPAGVAAKASNVLIQNCLFTNSPGTSCITMAQSNTAGVSLSTGWRVVNCRFINNGLNTSDVSNIFAWANDVIVTGCEFRNDVAPTDGQGIKTAFEVHGSDCRFIDNRIINAYQGIYVASNFTSLTNRVIISDNIFETIAYGIQFFRETAKEFPISDVTISNNQFAILDSAPVPPGLQKAAVSIATIFGVSDILITGNNASKSGAVDSAFVAIETRNDALSEKKTKIAVTNNTAYGFVQGVAIYSRFAVIGGSLGSITVKGNEFTVTGNGVSTTQTAGTIDSLDISGSNRFTNGNYGINLGAGTITLLNVQGNSYSNVGTANYVESATITTRTGDYDNIAYTAALTSIGSPASKPAFYTMRGNQVTVSVIVRMNGGTTYTGGQIGISLPFAAKNIDTRWFGSAVIYDSSAVAFYAKCHAFCVGGGTDIVIAVDGATTANTTAPVPLATGDEVQLSLTYERA